MPTKENVPQSSEIHGAIDPSNIATSSNAPPPTVGPPPTSPTPANQELFYAQLFQNIARERQPQATQVGIWAATDPGANPVEIYPEIRSLFPVPEPRPTSISNASPPHAPPVCGTRLCRKEVTRALGDYYGTRGQKRHTTQAAKAAYGAERRAIAALAESLWPPEDLASVGLNNRFELFQQADTVLQQADERLNSFQNAVADMGESPQIADLRHDLLNYQDFAEDFYASVFAGENLLRAYNRLQHIQIQPTQPFIPGLTKHQAQHDWEVAQDTFLSVVESVHYVLGQSLVLSASNTSPAPLNQPAPLTLAEARYNAALHSTSFAEREEAEDRLNSLRSFYYDPAAAALEAFYQQRAQGNIPAAPPTTGARSSSGLPTDTTLGSALIRLRARFAPPCVIPPNATSSNAAPTATGPSNRARSRSSPPTTTPPSFEKKPREPRSQSLGR